MRAWGAAQRGPGLLVLRDWGATANSLQATLGVLGQVFLGLCAALTALPSKPSSSYLAKAGLGLPCKALSCHPCRLSPSHLGLHLLLPQIPPRPEDHLLSMLRVDPFLASSSFATLHPSPPCLPKASLLCPFSLRLQPTRTLV